MLTIHAGIVTRILACSNGGYSNAWQFSEHRQSLTVLSVEPEMMWSAQVASTVTVPSWRYKVWTSTDGEMALPRFGFHILIQRSALPLSSRGMGRLVLGGRHARQLTSPWTTEPAGVVKERTQV